MFPLPSWLRQCLCLAVVLRFKPPLSIDDTLALREVTLVVFPLHAPAALAAGLSTLCSFLRTSPPLSSPESSSSSSASLPPEPPPPPPPPPLLLVPIISFRSLAQTLPFALRCPQEMAATMKNFTFDEIMAITEEKGLFGAPVLGLNEAVGNPQTGWNTQGRGTALATKGSGNTRLQCPSTLRGLNTASLSQTD